MAMLNQTSGYLAMWESRCLVAKQSGFDSRFCRGNYSVVWTDRVFQCPFSMFSRVRSRRRRSMHTIDQRSGEVTLFLRVYSGVHLQRTLNCTKHCEVLRAKAVIPPGQIISLLKSSFKQRSNLLVYKAYIRTLMT